jgi:hypothetical protein
MTTEEARRHDLYNAAIEIFGEVNAETFMALLPAHEGIDLANRDDLFGVSDRLSGRINHLEDRFDRLEHRFDRLETRMNQRFDAVNQRLDRLFLTLAAGLIAMIATVFAQALL